MHFKCVLNEITFRFHWGMYKRASKLEKTKTILNADCVFFGLRQIKANFVEVHSSMLVCIILSENIDKSGRNCGRTRDL